MWSPPRVTLRPAPTLRVDGSLREPPSPAGPGVGRASTTGVSAPSSTSTSGSTTGPFSATPPSRPSTCPSADVLLLPPTPPPLSLPLDSSSSHPHHCPYPWTRPPPTSPPTVVPAPGLVDSSSSHPTVLVPGLVLLLSHLVPAPGLVLLLPPRPPPSLPLTRTSTTRGTVADRGSCEGRGLHSGPTVTEGETTHGKEAGVRQGRQGGVVGKRPEGTERAKEDTGQQGHEQTTTDVEKRMSKGPPRNGTGGGRGTQR